MSPLQWFAAALGAFGFGLSKTGLPGVSILAVAIFALALPARESLGFVLPVLMCADLVAVWAYRHHANWQHLKKLVPPAFFGVVAGFFALRHLTGNHEVARLLGAILLILVPVQLWRRHQIKKRGEVAPLGPISTLLAGFAAGFFTMTANAAGPIVILYLLGMGLPKLAFVGTAAWFYFVMNWVKVPFSVGADLLNTQVLTAVIFIAPFSIFGALVGKRILPFFNQEAFENWALVFTVLAAIKLIW